VTAWATTQHRQRAAPLFSVRLIAANARLWEGGALLGIVAFCLLLRLHNLLALPIFLDEADSVQSAMIVGANPGPKTWLLPVAYGVYPLFAWLAAPFTRIISNPLLATRCASVVFGAFGLVAIWALGRTLRGPVVGLLAALLYALCPFTLFYNRLVVADGLMATCSAGVLLFAIHLSRYGYRRDAIALGLCLAAGTLTKIFALSMLLLPLLAVMTVEPPRRRLVRQGAWGAAVLGVLPLILMLFLAPDTARHMSDVQTRFVGAEALVGIIGNQLHVLTAAL